MVQGEGNSAVALDAPPAYFANQDPNQNQFIPPQPQQPAPQQYQQPFQEPQYAPYDPNLTYQQQPQPVEARYERQRPVVIAEQPEPKGMPLCSCVSQTCSLIACLVFAGVALLFFLGAIGVSNAVSNADWDWNIVDDNDVQTYHTKVGEGNTVHGFGSDSPSFFRLEVDLDTNDDPTQLKFTGCISSSSQSLFATARFAGPPSEQPNSPGSDDLSQLYSTYSIPSCASGRKVTIPMCYGNYDIWVRVESHPTAAFQLPYTIGQCGLHDCFNSSSDVCELAVWSWFFIIFAIMGVGFLIALGLCIIGACNCAVACCCCCCFTGLFIHSRQQRKCERAIYLLDENSQLVRNQPELVQQQQPYQQPQQPQQPI